MKIFRLHNIRTASVIILITSVLFHFMKPVNAEVQNDAFAFWLQSNVKSDISASVIDQIKGLHAENGEIESMIRQASILVKAHSEDFELPVDTKSQDENDVYQVLLKEWTAYQNSSSGMGKAVIIKQAQPHSLLPMDGFMFAGKSPTETQLAILAANSSSLKQISVPSSNYQITPLSGGIAIGAP